MYQTMYHVSLFSFLNSSIAPYAEDNDVRAGLGEKAHNVDNKVRRQRTITTLLLSHHTREEVGTYSFTKIFKIRPVGPAVVLAK